MGVDLGLRAEGDRQPEMRPRLIPSAQLLQALAEPEVSVVGRGIELQELLERRPSAIMLAAVVVRPAERLEDRCLAGLLAIGPRQHDGGRSEVALPQQGAPPLEELVRGLVVVGRTICHAPMVARSRESIRRDRWRPNPPQSVGWLVVSITVLSVGSGVISAVTFGPALWVASAALVVLIGVWLASLGSVLSGRAGG